MRKFHKMHAHVLLKPDLLSYFKNVWHMLIQAIPTKPDGKLTNWISQIVFNKFMNILKKNSYDTRSNWKGVSFFKHNYRFKDCFHVQNLE